MTQKNEAPTILIVDDTPSNLGMVVKLMEDRGYRVSIAQDGEEGLQRAQLLQPDLILLDVMMPGADGFEICLRLKALESTQHIPVMFMTALASPEHKVKGFAAGGIDYLTKPLHVDEVMARVDTHIKLNTAQRQLAVQNALLEKQRDELEMRVEERTAELGEANRKLHEEIEERERAYRRMVLLNFALDHVTEDVSLLDQNGMFQYVNEHACREMGFSRSKLQSMGVTDIDPDWSSERYTEFWQELQKQGTIRLETRHQSSEGRIFPVEVDANYFEYEGVGYNLTLVRDISERKAAEAALRASEREFRTLAENLPDNLARYDKQCRIVYMNPQLESFLNLKLEERFGKTPMESAPGPVYAEYQTRMAETIATGQPCEMELTLPDKGEGICYHHIRFVAERDERGEIIGALTIGRDITEQKEAERLLHEQEQAIRAVVENSPDAIARYDRQLRRTYVNPATQKLLGMPSEKIIGKTFEDVPAAPDNFAPVVRSVFESGKELHIEIPFRWANGEKGWGDARIVPEFGADGSVVSVLSIGRDITERKRTEDLLREERGLFVGGPTVVFKWKAQDGWPVEYVSPNVLEQFGYPPDQLTSGAVSFVSIVHPDDLARVAAEVAAYTAQGRSSYEQEYRIAHANGDYRWIYDFTIVSRNEDGAVDHYHGYVMDITERKTVDYALRESEEKYRTLISKIQAAVVVHGADTRILTSNPMAQQLLGLTEEQLYGKAAIDPNWHFFREDRSPMPLDGYPVNKVLASGQALRDYVLGIHRPGVENDVWGLVNADPVFDHEGKITQVIVTFIDITQRKRAEEALVSSEREFRTLAENIPDHIIRYDSNARKIYLNTATARLMGIEPSQVIGQAPEDTPNEIRAMKLDEFARRVRQVLDTGEPQEFEVALRHAQSGMQIHNVRFVAERDEQGKIVGALMVGRDITARKKMEEELREQELRYREIFDNASDGLYLLEETEDGRFRNLDINPAFVKLTGMSREQLIGKCVDETVPPETAQIVTAKYQRCIAANAPIVEEAELELPVGKRYFYSVLVPIRNGGPRRIVGITRDITEIKLVERSLEESRAQLRGLAAKNEAERENERKYIARAIYDELGQTLTGLQLDVAALSHQFGPTMPALTEHIKGTQELVNKSLTSLRNVAAMLRPSSLDMGIVLAIEWVAGRFTDNTGTVCEVHVSDADRDMNPGENISIALYRIVYELLTNVSRHAKANRVDISLGLKGRDYILEVKDNGTGFDAGNIKAGSFGLFDIRERVHRFGGQLAIGSTPGHGTEIKVSIPSL